MRLARALRFVSAAAALIGAAGSLNGCFHPREPPCAFTCISAGARCPAEYTCGADGLCHRDGAEGVCTLTPPDAGAAGGAGGAGVTGTAGAGANGAAGAGAEGTAGTAGAGGTG